MTPRRPPPKPQTFEEWLRDRPELERAAEAQAGDGLETCWDCNETRWLTEEHGCLRCMYSAEVDEDRLRWGQFMHGGFGVEWDQ